MSGPKLIELRRMRAARERQQNHDRCAAFGSEYSRLLEEFQEWGKRLARMGIADTDAVRPMERVQAEVSNLLGQGAHHEAARIFGEEVSRVRALVEKRRSVFQDRTILLQNRHRQLLRDCEVLSAERSALEEQLKLGLPIDFPESEKQRIRSLAEPGLQQVSPLQAPGYPESPEAVANFEKTEAEVGSALAAIRAARQQFEAEVNRTQAKVSSRPVASTVSTSPAVTEMLQRFTPASGSAAAGFKVVSEVERLLAELAVYSDDSFLANARVKAVAAQSESDPDRRRLLNEALMIDGNSRLKQLRELSRGREEIRCLIDKAAHLKDPAVDAIIAELQQLLASEQVPDLATVKARFQAAVADAEARREREYKRRALVESLKELGYETNEGLETALVKDGRLVLHRGDEKEYAVEMVANPELNQLQAALVRYAGTAEISEHQRRRDREREESWCEDHALLREKMAARGLETEFRMQMKPGEHPVKVIVDQNQSDALRRSTIESANNKKQSAPE